MSALSVSWCGRCGLGAPLPTLAWFVPPGGHAQPRPRPIVHSTVFNTVKAVASGGDGQVCDAPPTGELDATFRAMLARMEAWKDRYYDCIVPRKVHDEPELGDWVHRLRSERRRGLLSPAAVAALDALGFAWKVDPITAKWYHNLHAARHYKEVHGSGELPPDLEDPTGQHPDWVEAARWLHRQRELYRLQKLLLVRVRLIKEQLGVKLQREHSKPRRNMHAVLKQGNAQFKEEQQQRRQQRLAASAQAPDPGVAAVAGQSGAAGIQS